MTRSKSCRPLRVALVSMLLVAGCAGGGGGGSAEKDHAKARAGWLLTVEEGAPTEHRAIERFDIYLVEDERLPETFELHGAGFMFAGAFPMDVHVGYDEKFDNLIGGTFAILPAGGGDQSAPKNSTITIDGVELPVLSGDIMVEKLSGHWSGVEGDKTASGTFTLRVAGPEGERVIRGRFSAQIVSWG